MAWSVFATAVLTIAIAWRLSSSRYRNIDWLPGPSSWNWLYGNFAELLEYDISVALDRWHSAYGKVFRHRAIFGKTRLVVVDPLAVSHIFGKNADNYTKPLPLCQFRHGRQSDTA